MDKQMILVSGVGGTRLHWGGQTKDNQWAQRCGMNRRQQYYGTPLTPNEFKEIRTMADRYPDGLVCAKCFPGRVLPDTNADATDYAA